MRRTLLFLPFALFLGMGFFLWRGLSLDPSELPSALIDRPMPAFELAALDQAKGQYSQEDFKGRVALLNVWATWCPTCKQEHSYLNELKRKGVAIYGVNYKDERDKAVQWLVRDGDPYMLNIFDPEGRLGLDLGVYGAPETYVIDAEGVIRYRHVGAVDQQVWQTLKSVMLSVGWQEKG